MATTPPWAALQTENGALPRPAEHYKLVGLMFTNKPGSNFLRGLLVIGLPGGLSRTFTADPLTDTITTAQPHGLVKGQYVGISSEGTLPGGLHPNTRYYIINSTTNRLTLSLTPNGAPVDIADAGSGTHTLVEEGVTRPEHQARDIIIDRCYFTGTPFDIIRRSIGMHGIDVTLRNSFIERAKDINTDAQAIVSYNGTGPYTIENNFLEGATENVMFGGAIGGVIANPPLDPNGVTPADILVRFNYLAKNPARYKLERWQASMYVEAGKPIQGTTGATSYIALNSGTTGATEPLWPTVLNREVADGEVNWRAWAPAGSAYRWVVKNNFELKAAERAVIQHNVFEHMWKDGQETALNFKTENQARPGGEYAARTENILFRDNIIRSAPAAWKGSQGVRGKAANWQIVNNLFTNIDGTERTLQIAGMPFAGLVIDHNTIVSRNATAALILDCATGTLNEPVAFRNNILHRGRDGVKGCGAAEGNSSFQVYFCLGQYCPSDRVGANIIVGANRVQYATGTYNTCPTDAACAADYSAIRFSNPSEEDYSLAPDSVYKGRATDGTDIGVDMSTLPQIRNLRVQPSSTQAIISYELSAPIQNVPCVLEVSTKRDLSDLVPDVNPALFTRSDSDRRSSALTDGARHTFIVGNDVSESGLDGNSYSRALSPLKTYFYRLQCAGDTRTGQFTTTSGAGGSAQLKVPVPASPSGARIKVEFGYAENGAPGTLSSTSDVTADCTSGCEAMVDVKADTIVYYRLRITTDSGETVLPTQAAKSSQP
jgi:hypothetical protein